MKPVTHYLKAGVQLPLSDRAMHVITEWLYFHKQNPRLYDIYKDTAHKEKANARKHYGVQYLHERARYYHPDIKTIGDNYRLNNNHCAFYSRLMMERSPGLHVFFEVRPSYADLVDFSKVDF